MIVNYTEMGWQIIAQRSHGLLSAQICSHWKIDDRTEHWIETLIATAEHDDVFNEFENTELLDDNGAPKNFKETSFELSMAQRLIDMAQTKSAYVALLISKHIQFVHGQDPNASTFIEKLNAMEKTWLKIAGTTISEVSRSYAILEFCDAFSLLLCQGLIQPENRKIQISNGPDERQYDMFMKDGKLTVEPWPFEDFSFKISYESRIVRQLSFKTIKAFQAAVKAASVETHHITLVKP